MTASGTRLKRLGVASCTLAALAVGAVGCRDNGSSLPSEKEAQVKMTESNCEKISKNTSVRLSLTESGGKQGVRVEFVNNHSEPLWVAQEPVPAYRVDPQSENVIVSYGYFDDVYGAYRGRYMLPPMQKVLPQARHDWPIEHTALLQKIMKPDTVTLLRLRFALREFKPSNVRGQQPLDAYLQASCPIQSEPAVLIKK